MLLGRRRLSSTALTLVLEAFAPPGSRYLAAMPINLKFHTFAGNPLRSSNSDSTSSPTSALDALKSFLSGGDAESSAVARVLPFRKGRAWVLSTDSTSDSVPKWSIGWVSPAKVSGIPAEFFVYLGSDPEEEAGTVSWAVDVSNAENLQLGLPGDGFGFVDLRTLMVATNCADSDAMGALAIAGHVITCSYLLIPLFFCKRIDQKRANLMIPNAHLFNQPFVTMKATYSYFLFEFQPINLMMDIAVLDNACAIPPF